MSHCRRRRIQYKSALLKVRIVTEIGRW